MTESDWLPVHDGGWDGADVILEVTGSEWIQLDRGSHRRYKEWQDGYSG